MILIYAMTIKQYMKKYGIGPTAFGGMVGVQRDIVYKWNARRKKNRSFPRPETANKIVKATGGEVTLQDIYNA